MKQATRSKNFANTKFSSRTKFFYRMPACLHVICFCIYACNPLFIKSNVGKRACQKNRRVAFFRRKVRILSLLCRLWNRLANILYEIPLRSQSSFSQFHIPINTRRAYLCARDASLRRLRRYYAKYTREPSARNVIKISLLWATKSKQQF